ncbi:MAG TPA: hypothetical protein VF190_09470 [Rhodothermales bacterium]
MRSGLKWILLWVGLAVCVRPAAGQSILQQYQQARFQAKAEEILRRHGMRAVPRPPDHVPSAADTLAAWWNRHFVEPPPPPPPPPPFLNARWRPIRRLGRGYFEREYGSVMWAYAGNARHTRLDTTVTSELRARLESRLGSPTLTLVEVTGDSIPFTDASIQFEYWVVLNDSIPLRIMDVGGPLDRGLILVTTARLREQLPALRDALERELFEEATEEAYVDYYFDELSGLWYRTGYDGRRYFTERIPRPVLVRGRPFIPTDD